MLRLVFSRFRSFFADVFLRLPTDQRRAAAVHLRPSLFHPGLDRVRFGSDEIFDTAILKIINAL